MEMVLSLNFQTFFAVKVIGLNLKYFKYNFKYTLQVYFSNFGINGEVFEKQCLLI